MTKMRTRIGSIVLAVAMLLTLLPVTAFADGTDQTVSPVQVDSFEKLQNAQTAVKGSIIEVSGNITMEQPVTFTNKVTLKLTETANITYTSDNNAQIYLITLQDGSTLDMAAGARVVMTGTGTQNANRDWRVIYSDGALTVSQFAGEITVDNARGRGLYAKNDLTFTAPMAGKVTMNNPNGDNQYTCGIVSNAGNIVFEKGITGQIKVVFGGGKNGFGIIAQSGNVRINGDISGTIDVQLGTSHMGCGINAATGIIVTGDISGRIYARGGSGSGFGIFTWDGDISIAAISGSVTGDCYNEIMNNSQSGAAIYAYDGNIYGTDDTTPLALTGTLSSTVGRNDAFTVQAKGNVSIYMGEGASINARSSFGAEWTDVTGDTSKKPMSNNWGGAAAGVVAGGTIDIDGNDDAITVTSTSAGGNPIEAAFQAKTGKLENVSNITNFLYEVAEGDEDSIKAANAKLTSEDKAAIKGYDEMVEDLLTTKVNNEQALRDALDKAATGDIIALEGNIELSSPLVINTSVTINGNNFTIQASETFSGDVITVTADNTTIQNVKVNGCNKSGYGIQFYTAANGRLENVTATNNTKSGINVNASTVTAVGTIDLSGNSKNSINVGFGKNISSAPGASLDMTNATLVDVDFIYADAGDVQRADAANVAITVTDGNNTFVAVGDNILAPVYFVPESTVKDSAKIAVVNESGTPTYYRFVSSLQDAIDNAEDNSTIILAADEYTLNSNITLNKNVTIVGASQETTTIVAYNNQSTENDSRIKVGSGTQVKFENLTFTASYGADIVAPIIRVDGTGKLELNRCTITDTSVGYSSGYGLISTGNAVADSKVTMKNCTVNSVLGNNDNVTYYVLGQGGVCELDIQDNVFNLGSWFMFNIQASGIMKNNVFNGVDGASGRVVNATNLNGLVVEGNTFDESLYGTRFVIGGDYKITGNTFESLGDDLAIGIYNKPVTTAEISNNIFMMEDESYGIRVTADWGGAAGNLSNLILHNNTFNGNGIYEFRNDSWSGTADLSGSEATEEFTVNVGTETTIKLPDAIEKNGYAFLGWYDGNKLYNAGEEVTITSNTTFTARWTYIDQGSTSGDYLVNVNKVTGGKITVTPGRADKGDTVTITVKPNDGYELDTLVVTDKNGNTVKLTDKGNGKYTFTMPGSQVTVNASFAKDSSSPVDSFLDVNTGAWYYDAVKYAVESGLMSGTGTYTFEPNTTLSRGMIAQMLYALEGKPSISSANNFTDVSSSDWYDKAASWAQSKGIITGYEDGRFGPNDPLTREQLALILYNYAKSEGYGTSAKADLSKFADGTSTSPWAQQAMSWAVGEGLLSGRGVNMLYPTGTATRAEVAQIMMNFCENVAK